MAQLVKLRPGPSQLKWANRLKGIFEFQRVKTGTAQARLLSEAPRELLLGAPGAAASQAAGLPAGQMLILIPD